MPKTIVAKVETAGVVKIVAFVAIFIILCGLAIPRYVIETTTPSKYLVVLVVLVAAAVGVWLVVRVIQRTYIYGVISLDAKNLYIGRRRIAWKKIAQIYTVQRHHETYLVVTLEFIPVDKVLLFEEDDAAGPSDSSAYRLNLANFNLPPEKIEQILNEELRKHQKTAEKPS